MTYDSTTDTMNHIVGVSLVIVNVFMDALHRRAGQHDSSKLLEPEKPMYDKFRPLLKTLELDSPEYKASLQAMGEGLKHHYAVNRHHPEHFENGISGMNLVDIVEMVSDWYTASKDGHRPFNAEYMRQRFGISDQLMQIITNTIEMIETYTPTKKAPR